MHSQVVTACIRSAARPSRISVPFSATKSRKRCRTYCFLAFIFHCPETEWQQLWHEAPWYSSYIYRHDVNTRKKWEVRLVWNLCTIYQYNIATRHWNFGRIISGFVHRYFTTEWLILCPEQHFPNVGDSFIRMQKKKVLPWNSLLTHSLPAI